MKKSRIILVMLAVICMVFTFLPGLSKALGEAIAIAVEVNNFNSSNTSGAGGSTLIRTAGTAAPTGGILRLTENTGSQAGTAVRRNQIKLTDGFSTYFQFKVTSTSTPADGLAFIVYANNDVQIGAYGGGLGYAGVNNSIIVEFDTYYNSEFSDPGSPHVGIMVNGNCYHSGQTGYAYPSLTSGSVIHAWVDYDGSTVTVTYGTSSTRSSNTTISRNVGSTLVGQNVFVGFSASTGGCYSYHDLLKWYFKDAYVSGGLSSDPNSYTQAAGTLGITLSPSSADPASANIKVYDASGVVMTSNVDIYIDNALVTTAAAGVSGYTYSLSGLATGNHTIRAVAPGGASNYASFSITAYPPNIQSSPSARSVNVGDTASFSVSATSPDGGGLSYQWQLYSGSWGNISGATGSTYTTDTLAITDNGKRYRCVVTNTNGTKVASIPSGEALLTVNRLTGTVSITGDPSKTYDGTAAADPAVTKNGSGAVTYTYYADNSGSIGSALPGAPVNAGTYWVRATVAQCETYTQATSTKQFTIARNAIDDEAEAELLLSYSLDTKTYNTSPQPVSVSAASGVSGLGSITVYYEGTGGTVYAKSTTAPTNVGTYAVSVDIAEGSNYGSYSGLELGSYTIEKAAITGVTDAGYSDTYDGKAHGIMLSGVPSGAAVAYRVGGSGEYDLTDAPVFTNIGTYTVDYKITKPNYLDLTGSEQVEITKRAITTSMLEDISGTFTYNGTAQTPAAVITDGEPSMIAASDYTVSYSDNTYPGTASVTVTATADGNYNGSVTKTFDINKKALEDSMIAYIDDLVFSGAAQMPSLTITDGTPSIITASDYTVSYSDNTYPGTATATITAAADGNYKGKASRTFVVNKKELHPNMIAAITPVTYNGLAQTPALTVTDGTPSIITASDYTVSYSNNTNAGTATASVIATADGNYTGLASVTFTIRKKALDAAMIADIAPVEYNGTSYTPVPAVTDGTPSIIVVADYMVGYANNINAGTATVSVTAMQNGNYSGSVSKTFVINKKMLTPAMVGGIAAQVYTGEALRPSVSVTDGDPSIIKPKDYTVSSSNNTDSGAGTVIVTALETGNYTGSVRKTFIINTATIQGSISVPATAVTGDTVKANVSGILPAGARTGLSYQWTRNGLDIAGATGDAYTITSDDAGKQINVIVEGTGNYSGSITSYAINATAPKAPATSPITLAAPVFKGGTVTIGGTVTLPGTYTANISYKTEKDALWDVAESGSYKSGNSFGKELTGLEPDTIYIYRITVMADGQTYTMTGRFHTPAAESSASFKGSITGSVKDNTGMNKAITVTVEEGNTVIASRTGLKNGDAFTFEQLPDGIYNVVANNGSCRVTQIITVKNGEAVGGVNMTLEKKQSVVEVKTEGTPNIAVGGLNELFKYDSMYTKADAQVVAAGGTVEIKLIAEKQENSSVTETEKDKISEAAGGGSIAMYLDLSVIKTVTGSGSEGEETSLTETAEPIEVVIPIPENLKGKGGLTIYRMHNDIAEAIPEGVEHANADGEYCVVSDDYITLYLKKFCTYAIGYSEEQAHEQGCNVHWWLLGVLVVLIALGIIVTSHNSKRLKKAEGGTSI